MDLNLKLFQAAKSVDYNLYIRIKASEMVDHERQTA